MTLLFQNFLAIVLAAGLEKDLCFEANVTVNLSQYAVQPFYREHDILGRQC